MKRLFFLLLLMLAVLIGQSQQLLQINTETEQISRSKTPAGDPDSRFNRIVIHLPDSGFDKIRIRINKIDLGFYNKTKPPAKDFIPLYAQDIVSGQIVLKLKGHQLIAIGDRVSPYLDTVLKGKDSVWVWLNADSAGKKTNMHDDLGFYKTKETEQPVAKPGGKSPGFTSKYCTPTFKDSLTVAYLPGLSFLCDEGKKNDTGNCFCAPALSDPYSQLYLPPCYDKDGIAVSATKHILVDTRASTDPLFKVGLYSFVSGKYKCEDGKKGKVEYAKKQKKMYLEEGTLVPITVIAHKDSVIVIDSNYRNYFLDSAEAVETQFTDAGKKTTEATKPEKGTGTAEEKSVQLVQSTVNLRNDLMAFNSVFKSANFVQQYYIKQLSCLQKKIADFYGLPFIPATGEDLASAIDNTIAPEAARKYAYFLCSILGQIAEQYDRAIKHQSDFVQYTKYIQVPNADDITFKARTKNSTDLFGQTFLIKGGWKIDFSTGVFVTGLNSQEFVQVSHRFAYRDSLTGPLKDTTGNLLSANKGKLNFSTGFLVHLYKRSGTYFNWGAVTGITINDDDFKMLFGGSAMFRMGNGRLSFVAGGAVGKQKQLDANQQQYNIKSADLPSNRVYIQNDINNRLPRFYAETNISTYDKLKLSWFAGITYNFAGLSLGK